MKHRCWLFGLSFLFVFLLSSCGSAGVHDSDEGESDDSNSIVLLDSVGPERKIIYKVDISFNVINLDEAIEHLHLQIADDGWFDQEILNEDSAIFTVRIKTERLDGLIDILKAEYALRNYQKVGTDISLTYQDTTNHLISLEAQRTRLNQLYAAASLSEMIIINEQLSEIEVEIARLQGTLNQFDSLADYSEVHLSFYASAISTQSPFFNRILSALETGFRGLLAFFDGLVIILATIFPFALVIVPIGYGIYRFDKKQQIKRRIKREQEHHQLPK